MRDRFPLAVLGALALAAVLGQALLQGGRRGAFADRQSTFRSEPDGTRALYLLLEAQHLPVARWQRPLDELPAGAPLVLLGVAFTDDAPLEVADGGVAAGGPGGEPVDAREAARLLAHVEAGATLVYAPEGVRSNALLRALEVELQPAELGTEVRTLVPAQPSVYTLGVERLEAPAPASLRLPDGAVPLLLDEARDLVVAALVRHGEGRVLVLAAPAVLGNRHLALADNARFATALARELAGEQPVLFDELHHGFSTQRSLGDFAARYGLDLAAAQLLLGLGLWALSLRRLGAVRQPARELRVGTTDALAALSRIYREGRHHGHAAAALAQGLCAELAPRAGLGPGSSPAQVALGLEARGRQALARSLRDVTARAAAVTTDRELLALARLASLSRRLQPASPP